MHLRHQELILDTIVGHWGHVYSLLDSFLDCHVAPFGASGSHVCTTAVCTLSETPSTASAFCTDGGTDGGTGTGYSGTGGTF